MDKADRLEDIANTYAEFEKKMRERGIEFGETDKGYWVPINFPEAVVFAEYIKRLVRLETKQKNNGKEESKLGPIVNVDSGDGRMLAILEVLGFNPIIGVEPNKKLYDASVYLIEDLIQRKTIHDGVVSIIHGDYTKPDTYLKAGLSFEEVTYFYADNFRSLNQLARLIKKSSPDDMRLFVFGTFFEEKDLPKIPLERVKRVSLNPILTHKLAKDFFMYPLGELVVYKK